MPESDIVVGTILKPQGIRGEVKIAPLTDDINRFKSVKYLIYDGVSHRVTSVRIGDGAVYVGFEDVPDRNTAETLRMKQVSVKRADAVKLPKGRYFIVDLIGCEVYAGDRHVGRVREILQNGCADVYCIDGEGRPMFPAADGVITMTDVDGKRIEVDPKRFDEVVCYED